MSGTITYFEIPTSSQAQTFNITLNGVDYTMTLVYRDTNMGGWVLNIADSNGNDMVCGIPLITGANLLDQYAYLGINGTLIAFTDGNFLAPPTFANLGTTSHLWFGIQNS